MIPDASPVAAHWWTDPKWGWLVHILTGVVVNAGIALVTGVATALTSGQTQYAVDPAVQLGINTIAQGAVSWLRHQGS